MLYNPSADEIMTEQLNCLELLYDYNATRPHEQEKRAALLKEMFAELGEGCYIEPPFRANWGGRHIHAGKNFYANFNLTVVDDAEVFIGDNVMLAPNVTLATAGHPIQPQLRAQAMQYNLPVTIGSNVWIGANSTVMPGVHIGDNSVIGAGSLVTRDIPANVVAMGSPCRVVRPIGEHDDEFYYRERRIDWENLK